MVSKGPWTSFDTAWCMKIVQSSPFIAYLIQTQMCVEQGHVVDPKISLPCNFTKEL